MSLGPIFSCFMLRHAVRSPGGESASFRVARHGVKATARDDETAVRKILDILQSIISQAGDLIESRSPELVRAARAALTRYDDEALAEAE